MLKRFFPYLLAAFMSLPQGVKADGLDDLVDLISIDEQKGEWRDHFGLSFFQTVSDSYFLSQFKGNNGRSSSQKTRFLEVVVHQGLYSPIAERKITPTYALSDILGIETADLLYDRIEPHLEWFDSLDKRPDREELIDLGILFSLSYIVGGREPISLDLHAEERIDRTLLFHSVYFGYTTFRTSLQVNELSKGEHPLEKVAWRAFKIGLLKELVFDAALGTGPSVLDALADGIGVYVGYGLADLCLKHNNRVKLRFNGKGIAVDYLIDK
ncbi:hypothetical protein HY500_01800 [Candidatus Woesearchaeota archaeon]|nr:hypothetical protein [Candidatus Woesearchaeota archaeon]